MYQIPNSFFEICPKDDRLMIVSVSDVLYTIQTPDSNTNANAGYCIKLMNIAQSCFVIINSEMCQVEGHRLHYAAYC